MKLIKLEAHGFKSFADPVVLRFNGGVAGIVGPNGSGKSNINDAIRWVLGEQSSKELRGDSMEDVIFAGSKTVQPMNRAQVTLTFDNRDRLSSIDADYISISRVLERGKGINDYFINGEKSRHKDIKTIAMETGIGKSSLAIISQGTVSDIAQSSDEDRRMIFEEAAGVSKYKFRKLEATRKLDSAEQTLKIVDAKITELEKRLEVLKKQAEKAYKYKEKSEMLKSIEVGYLAYNIDKNSELEEKLSKELEGVNETEESYKKDIQTIESHIDNKLELLKEVNKSIAENSGKKTTLEVRINSLEKAIAELRIRRSITAEGGGSISNEERMKAIISEVNSLEITLKQLKSSYDELFKNKHESQEKINTITNDINSLNIKLQQVNDDESQAKIQLNILSDLKRNRTNLFLGTKTILDNKTIFKGFKGIVADLIKTPNEYLVALETILKNAAQHIVVDHSDTAVKAINFLKKNNGGRATFIPLWTIQAKFVRDDYLFAIRNHPGFVGIASELVSVEDDFRKLSEFLLGNVIVVSDIKTANEISTIMEKKYMVVTLEGDIIRVGGVMVGGTAESSENVLGMDDKIERLKNLLPGFAAIKEKLRSQVEIKKDELRKEENSQKHIEVQLGSLNATIASEEKRSNELKANITVNNLENNSDEFKNLNDAELQISELNKELSILVFNINTAIDEKNSLEADIESLRKKNIENNKMLNSLLSSFKEKNTILTKALSELELDRERLNAHYGMTLEYAKENFKLEMSPQLAAENVRDLRIEISELGNVNIDSIEEYEEVLARYTEDVSNRDEVIEAKNICIAAINEMDKKIVTRLSNIVNDVNQEMHKVFSSMFGGGTAKVEFVDANNILESGISIYAQPPGKTVKNLKLFSGGEKALIAISLLFAILRARPLPLCILDEVEAALDEANVVRYAEYLQELKEKTQFLVITHRTGTMTRVDALFGATMQKRGVTNFFSVELEEAKKLIEQD
ncbi:chromosomal segregation and condensation complex, SMC protein [Mycoplasmopsis canis UFG4]|uniref:Chromosome partition protein Smc n=1 Tax=Mycoplasmopsis canis UFG4 TaxID=1131455 RepID=I1A6N6_9BACT|nr:AAA family ATPase [Mycoplasmopsis canis]EIE42157.1 chromosomal segregation and condensation complex, SMC protein [Mycoplasmopsis canis UFG4]